MQSSFSCLLLRALLHIMSVRIGTRFPTWGVNPLWSILSGIRNSLCRTLWRSTHFDAMTQSFMFPDFGFSFCRIWDRKNVDNGRRTEAKEENFFFSLNFRNVYWAAHYSLFGCRIFTLPKPSMWSRVFWQLRSLFSFATFVSSDLPEGEPGSPSSGVQRVLFC